MKAKTTAAPKAPPVVEASVLSPEPDAYGRRLLFRLLLWPDGGRSIAVGLAEKVEGSTMPSNFIRGKYVSLPVSILPSLVGCARTFTEKANAVLRS